MVVLLATMMVRRVGPVRSAHLGTLGLLKRLGVARAVVVDSKPQEGFQGTVRLGIFLLLVQGEQQVTRLAGTPLVAGRVARRFWGVAHGEHAQR